MLVQQKIKNIEFLRFIFIIVLVYCHLPLLTSVFPDVSLYSFITHNAKFSVLVVDFFFILSGFFLKYTLNTEMDTFDYLKKKFIRLWSVVAFAIICYWCLNCFNISSYGDNIYNSLFSFFFIDNIGITLHHCGPSWYVSVLVLVSLFYFYLFKALPEKVANLIIGFLVWFSYTFTINADNGAIAQHIMVQNNIFCMGLLRGLGGIGLGIFLYYAYQKFKDSIPAGNKMTYTLLEFALLGWCLYAMVSAPEAIHNSMIFIIAFLLLIWLFLIKKGYLSKVTDSNFFVVLGRYCYSIFLTHLVIVYLLKDTIWNASNLFIQNHPVITLLLLYFSIFILAIIVYYFIEKPNNHLFKKFGFLKYYLIIFTSLLVLSLYTGYVLTHKQLKLDKTYKFNREHIYITLDGVSKIEKWGRWSNGNIVKIKFYIPVKKDLNIKFDINPFFPNEVKKQTIKIYSKKELLSTWEYRQGEIFPKTNLDIPKDLIKHGQLTLRFEIEKPISPADLGLSNDKRKLGIGFKTMTIRERK